MKPDAYCRWMVLAGLLGHDRAVNGTTSVWDSKNGLLRIILNRVSMSTDPSHENYELLGVQTTSIFRFSLSCAKIVVLGVQE